MGIFEGIESIKVSKNKCPLSAPQGAIKYEEAIGKTQHKGEGEFYQVWQILELVDARLRRVGVTTVYTNTSKRNVPYILFYHSVGHRKSCFTISWFAGSATRQFRGFKLFWTPPYCTHGKQRKAKFHVPGYEGSKVWEKGCGDPRSAIVEAAKSLIKFIEEATPEAIFQED